MNTAANFFEKQKKNIFLTDNNDFVRQRSGTLRKEESSKERPIKSPKSHPIEEHVDIINKVQVKEGRIVN